MMKFLGVAAAAVLLGMVSPFMAAADDGPALRAWFQWLPVQVDQLVMPDGELMMLVLAMVVLSAQYLMVFMLAMPVRELLRRLLSSVRTQLHRGTSIRVIR